LARFQLICNLEHLQALAPEWDELAVANAMPAMSPAWILAWFRHLAPDGVEPRAVVARDGQQLIGIAPFYVDTTRAGRIDYRLPGIEVGIRLTPLARSGREWEVAGVIAEALADSQPRPDIVALESLPSGSIWIDAIARLWPGRIRASGRTYNVMSAPSVGLDADGFEQWLADRSSNFRGQMRRAHRQFLAAGGTVRSATSASLTADVATLAALHATRWRDRAGVSKWVELGERVPAMIEAAGRALLDDRRDRFRLQMLEISGEPISAQLFIAAGGDVLYVNGGWDERYSSLKPALLSILLAIEDGFDHGDARLDLGTGTLGYKRRFSNGDKPVSWGLVIAPTRRMPLTVARTAPMLARAHARAAAKRILSDEQVEHARGLRTGVRRLSGSTLSRAARYRGGGEAANR
jgi:CelD/BcsL family acetyltransferase involved in cellulose biosynthesis